MPDRDSYMAALELHTQSIKRARECVERALGAKCPADVVVPSDPAFGAVVEFVGCSCDTVVLAPRLVATQQPAEQVLLFARSRVGAHDDQR